MIRRIHLKRFKCFHHLAIPCAPITLLLGANSVGKSSILQALLLLQQSAPTTADLGVLRTEGPGVDLGWFGNVVHGQEPPNPDGEEDADLELGFTWGGWGLRLQHAAPDWGGEGEALPRRGQLQQLIMEGPGGERYCWFVEGADGPDRLRGDVARLQLCADASTSARLGRSLSRGYTEQVSEGSAGLRALKEGRLQVRAVLMGDDLAETFVEPAVPEGGDDTLGLTTEEALALQGRVAELFRDHLSPLRHLVQRMRWLGPLRSTGRRFYTHGPDHTSTLAPDGDNLPVLLNASTLPRVNEWMQTLELPYTIGVESGGVSGLVAEVVLQREGGVRHVVGLPDVGTGLAQVLPLLALCADAAESPTTDVLLLQQPELHLHPRQQGLLAPIFRDTVAGNGENRNQLIVETHSETLVLHLQYLVSQGELAPEDVCLIAMSRDANGMVGAEPVPLDVRGSLEGPWPGGFFPDAAVLRRRIR